VRPGSAASHRTLVLCRDSAHQVVADDVRDKSIVRVRVAGDRELVFGDVLVRVDPSFALAMHIDPDEANAANVKTGARGFIDGIQSEA